MGGGAGGVGAARAAHTLVPLTLAPPGSCLGVEVRVVDDARVGRGQGDALAARPGGEQEDERVRAGRLVAVDRRLPRPGRHPAIDALHREAPRGARVLQDVEHDLELGEDEDLAGLGLGVLFFGRVFLGVGDCRGCPRPPRPPPCAPRPAAWAAVWTGAPSCPRRRRGRRCRPPRALRPPRARKSRPRAPRRATGGSTPCAAPWPGCAVGAGWPWRRRRAGCRPSSRTRPGEGRGVGRAPPTPPPTRTL